MSEMEKQEVMVDIETLGNGSHACILSIGACLFKPHGQGIDSHFEIFVDPESCEKFGRKIDASTVMWWMDAQRDAARKEMMAPALPRLPLDVALRAFNEWFGADKPVWGNGATFDNVILANAYKAAGVEQPWKFWNDRCYRTMKNVAPSVKLTRVGTHHSAAQDAVTQALHLQQIFSFLSGE